VTWGECSQWFNVLSSDQVLGWNWTGTIAKGLTLSTNRTALKLQCVGQFHIFAYPDLWHQLSIWVMIVSQYKTYKYHAGLNALLPNILQFGNRWIFVQSLWNTGEHWTLFAVTPWLLIRMQFGERDEKEHPILHNLGMYHIMTHSELKNWIGDKVLSLQKWDSAV